MEANQIGMLAVIFIYLIGMVVIGAFLSKQNETAHDFYLGGRKLGPFVTAMSAEASDMSSWLLMGLPGVAYLSGIADAGWTALGLAIGTYVNWLIIAKRIRLYTEVSKNSFTIPDFFSNRFRDKKKILMLISSLFIIIFFIPYTASGFAACGKLFSSLFGIDYFTAMVVSAVVIILYTAMGGFLAASTTDFIQSIIMSVALIIILVFGINAAGGMDMVINNAKELPGYLSMVSTHNMTTGSAESYGFLTIVSKMAWGLGYFGMPHILLRFMAIEDKDKLKISRRVASIWVVISMFASILIGIIGYGMTKASVIPFLEGTSSETVIVQIANVLSTHGWIFACFAGVILAGILASTMSTADSQLLAASSSVSENIIGGFFGKELDGKKRMVVARGCLIAIAVLGIFLAKDPNSSVFSIVSFAWAGFGAVFGPVVLFALFWRRANKYGAIASMISGGVMVFLWKYVISNLGGLFDIYELLPAFLTGCIFMVVVSLLTPEPEKEITDEYDKVQSLL